MKLESEEKTVILLHGWGLNSNSMKDVEDYLKNKIRVINFDLPGFGNHEMNCAWKLDDYIEYVHKICVDKDINQPIFIAHSFGGRIALKYASIYPVEKMILTGCAGICPKRTLSYYFKIGLYKCKKRMHLNTEGMGSEDYLNSSGYIRETLVNILKEDLSPILSEIKTDTLLIWGEKDEATPLYMGEIMEEKLQHAKLVIFAGEDHFAYLHQIERFLILTTSFLMV